MGGKATVNWMSTVSTQNPNVEDSYVDVCESWRMLCGFKESWWIILPLLLEVRPISEKFPHQFSFSAVNYRTVGPTLKNMTLKKSVLKCIKEIKCTLKKKWHFYLTCQQELFPISLTHKSYRGRLWRSDQKNRRLLRIGSLTSSDLSPPEWFLDRHWFCPRRKFWFHHQPFAL